MLALRARQQRNLLATLLLSQGVPMLLAGDEVGKSQKGNNNTYCQDAPLNVARLVVSLGSRHYTTSSSRSPQVRRSCDASAARVVFSRRRSLPRGGRKDIAWLRTGRASR